MTVLAIQEILRQQKTLEEAKNTFKIEHNLQVKEHIISGRKIIVLTRDEELKHTSVVQDEASLVIIDENLNIVAKGLDKLYKANVDYVGLSLLHNEDKAVTVQEWNDGIEIVISKFNNTFLISTKDHIHGHPYSKIVLDIINEKFPNKGLNSLFDPAWFNDINWVFNLVSKNNKHELYLTGIFDVKKLQELNTTQVDNIAVYLNLKTNKHQTIYTKNQLKDAIYVFSTRNINLDHVIVKDEQGSSFKILVRKNRKNNTLTYIAKCIIEHDQRQLDTVDKKYSELISLIKYRYHSCTLELCKLFTKNENIRTRKIYASKVKHHPMAAAIFALKDNKITGFRNMSRVIKPIHLLSIVEKEDHTKFYDLLKGI